MTRLHAVDYESGRALFELDGRSVVVDINKKDAAVSDESALTAGAWMKVSKDFSYPAVWRELAEASVATLEVQESKPVQAERKFRVPESVKKEAQQSLDWVHDFSRGGSVVGESLAKRLVNNTYVTLTDVARLHRYFTRLEDRGAQDGWTPGQRGFPTNERIRFGMRGGSASQAWVTKIATKHPITAAIPGEADPMDVDGNQPHEFIDDPDVPGFCEVCGREPADELHEGAASTGGFEYDEENDYFGKGVDPDSTYSTELYVHHPDDTWGIYDGTGFVDIEAPSDETVVIMLDEDTTKTLAKFVEDRDPDDQESGIELSMLIPHEAALANAAHAEIDWGFIEMVEEVFDIYDSQERSVNAKKQMRGQGGKFGDQPDTVEDQEQGAQVARLPQQLPLVQDVAGLIQQYLATAGQGQTAPEPAPTQQPVDETQASTVEYLNKLIQFADAQPDGAGNVRPLYMAIVDAVDTQAVLDVVALMPGPILWKRNAGQWVQDNNLLAQLQGTTPPPVVELQEDAVVADVLTQVDAATSGNAEEDNGEVPGATEQRPDGSSGVKPDANPDQHPVAAAGTGVEQIKKGYALPDGTFNIVTVADLKNAVTATAYAKNYTTTQKHILKRARALNRLDLVPDSWVKSLSSSDEYPLWGPNGEIATLTAEGGLDRNRGGAEKLRRYWLTGEGGTVKVRWNTPGDWTRCYKHLRKYLGERAKGYCTLRHHEATGRWPGERDENGNL